MSRATAWAEESILTLWASHLSRSIWGLLGYMESGLDSEVSPSIRENITLSMTWPKNTRLALWLPGLTKTKLKSSFTGGKVQLFLLTRIA